MSADALAAGVYRVREDGSVECVHEYVGDGYELADVWEQFGLGRPSEGDTALELTRHELRTLRIQADAHSFDHPAEMIEMCLDIARVELAENEATLRLISRA